MSGTEFLLDTNILIGLAKGPGPARDLLDSHGADPGRSAVSQITRIELLSFPALTAGDEVHLKAMLSATAVILLDEQIELAAIALRRRTGLKVPDAIIGATASVFKLKLLTLDDRFAMALQS